MLEITIIDYRDGELTNWGKVEDLEEERLGAEEKLGKRKTGGRSVIIGTGRLGLRCDLILPLSRRETTAEAQETLDGRVQRLLWA